MNGGSNNLSFTDIGDLVLTSTNTSILNSSGDVGVTSQTGAILIQSGTGENVVISPNSGVLAIDGSTVNSGNFRLTGQFIDGSGNSGTSGQVLISTGASTEWNNIVSSDANNKLTTGTDGGAFFAGPVSIAAGKVNGNGAALKIFGATVRRIDEGDYEVTFNTPRTDDDYIIQLTVFDCNGDCPGNTAANFDNPGITYYQQVTTGFRINIGDSDNGANEKDDIDLEFMFNVIDF